MAQLAVQKQHCDGSVLMITPAIGVQVAGSGCGYASCDWIVIDEEGPEFPMDSRGRVIICNKPRGICHPAIQSQIGSW